MREIKFRAWDKENKEMVDLDFVGEDVIKISNGEWENKENFIVMQHLWAFDLNGNYVYEGDIVEYRPNEYWIVTERYFEIGIESLDGYFMMFQESGLDFEVVGNIYENPELLENASN